MGNPTSWGIRDSVSRQCFDSLSDARNGVVNLNFLDSFHELLETTQFRHSLRLGIILNALKFEFFILI